MADGASIFCTQQNVPSYSKGMEKMPGPRLHEARLKDLQNLGLPKLHGDKGQRSRCVYINNNKNTIGVLLKRPNIHLAFVHELIQKHHIPHNPSTKIREETSL